MLKAHEERREERFVVLGFHSLQFPGSNSRKIQSFILQNTGKLMALLENAVETYDLNRYTIGFHPPVM